MESDAFLLCPTMKLGFAQASKAQVSKFDRSAGPQVVHLTAIYVTKASIKIGTRVNTTMGAGAQEPLLTPFIEFVDNSFTVNCT